MAPWSQWVPKCHNGLHCSMKPHNVTVVPLVPQGPTVSQWTLGSMRFLSHKGSPWICRVTVAHWLHVATLCHSGSRFHERSYCQQRSPWFHSATMDPWICIVTMDPSFHVALLCHNVLLGSTRPCSVTVAPWLRVAPLCHNGSDLHEATKCQNGPLVS